MIDPDDENLGLQTALRAAYQDAVQYSDEVLSPDRVIAQKLYNGDKFGALAEEDGRSSVVLSEVRDTILSMLPSLLRVLCGAKVFEFLPRNSSDVELAETLSLYIGEVVLGLDNSGFKILHDAIKDALLFKMGVVRWYWDESQKVCIETYSGLSQEQAELLKSAKDEEPPEVLEEEIEICNCDGMDPEHVEHLQGLAEAGEPLPQPGTPILPPPGLPPGAPPGTPPPVVQPDGPGTLDDQDQAASLSQAAAQTGMDPAAMSQAAMPHGIEVKVKKLTLKRVRKEGRARVMCIPPEEFLADFRRARDIQTSNFVGHRSYRTVSEVVSMFPEQRELIEEHVGSDGFGLSHQEEFARNSGAYNWGETSNPDPSQRRVLLIDAEILFDSDDDGIAERHRVLAIGADMVILSDEIVPDECTYAVFSVDSVPHTLIGQSIADQTGDLQLIKSSVLRSTLDSLAQSIHPRTVVVTRDVESMDDVLNNETGAIIRVRNPGAVQELTSTFVGQQSLPVLAYMDEIRSRRTGITATTTGLDESALQSVSPTAIAAAQEAGQQRLELVARMLAETGLRPLAKGLLRLIVRHQDRPRMVRLREKQVAIDPTGADIEMDVAVHVAIGKGDDTQKQAMLALALSKIEQVMQVLGPMNPIAGVVEWTNCVRDIADLGGIKNTERYLAAITPQVMQQLQQSAGGANKPDPNMLLAQAELAKAQAEAKKIEVDAVVAQAKLDLDREKMHLEDDRARRRDLYEMELKASEIMAKYGSNVDVARMEANVNAELERDRHLMSMLTDVAKHVTPQPPAGPPQEPMPSAPIPPEPMPPAPSPGGMP